MTAGPARRKLDSRTGAGGQGSDRWNRVELRDQGVINDQTLRLIEREVDLEELRMEG